MIVATGGAVGTIGGGRLEYECTRIARQALTEHKAPGLRRLPLGPSLGQCCGGVVDVLFEPMRRNESGGWLNALRRLRKQRQPAVVCTNVNRVGQKCVVSTDSVHGCDDLTQAKATMEEARRILETLQPAYRRGDWFFDLVVDTDFNIAVFGAGHVGSAVVQSLSTLDCAIQWIDARSTLFPTTPRNVRTFDSEDPSSRVPEMPTHSFYIVMTHSHPLDFEICSRVLQRGDAAYCGLIGSRSKRRRFEKRFRELGIQPSAIDQLVCPIGIDGIRGKKPAEIAIAVSSEVLLVHERMRGCAGLARTEYVHSTRSGRA